MIIQAGQLIGGKYELERMLGKGSMGEVWRARHSTLDDAYAVKLIDLRTVPDAGARFRMEAHIASKLSKKTRHIVSVTDHGEQGSLAYLVMQLLEGQPLDERILRGAPLPFAEVSMIVSQVSRALAHAHAEGFVHRDLKPANIFLTADEDGHLVVKLLDFGIARNLTQRRERDKFATAKDTIVGTPSYMSPEQTRGLSSLDHRCDLWALAVVAYEALTNALPFEGETLQDILISIGIGRQIPISTRRHDLPAAVVAFYERAFAEEIDDRFSSAKDLAQTFASAVDAGGSARPAMASVPSYPPPHESLGTMPGISPSMVPPPPRLPTAGSPAGSEGSVSESSRTLRLPMRRALPRGAWIGLAVFLAGLAFVTVRLLRTSPPDEDPASSLAQPPHVAPPPVLAPSAASSAAPTSLEFSAEDLEFGAAEEKGHGRRRPRPITHIATSGEPRVTDAGPPAAEPTVSSTASSPPPSPPPPLKAVPAPARSIDKAEVF